MPQFLLCFGLEPETLSLPGAPKNKRVDATCPVNTSVMCFNTVAGSQVYFIFLFHSNAFYQL